MRVALIQLAMEGKSRSADIQHLARVIDQALRAAPATDLVVLPGACDTSGAAVRDRHEEGALAAFHETLAFQAREWGVHLAAGLHERHLAKLLPCAVLFDADGDVAAQCFGGSGAAAQAESDLPACWTTVFGDVGVYEPSRDSAMPRGPASGERGKFMAVPCSPVSATSRRRTARFARAVLQDPLIRGGAYWGFASLAGSPAPADEREAPATFVCAPDGSVLAAAESAGEAVIYAEVPLTAASAQEPCGT